ncbi:sensor histidine kinase [Larkinella rosea]|uniref:histidine kinase n=1 Tax=Larkinella rosea TaxID=2025312 RepID=A0A3P1BH35_9BACT|nr:HAMP domain-containing sensor histidine kinase [Larkinella rosea]RRA99883.1 HAMP domain-containing protein [Larkinella rosea]
MSILNKHIFLILSILALGLSVFFYSVLERGAISAADEQYLLTTQQRIKTELNTSLEELQRISQLMEDTIPNKLADLSLETKYPYYIFRNKQLLYWSDFRFIPDYQRLKSIIYPKLISFPQGKYLVNRQFIRKGADSLEVFSLVNVYRQYQIENSYLRSGFNPDLFSLPPQKITLEKGSIYRSMYDQTPVFLFTVVPPQLEGYQNQTSPVNTVVLALLSVFFMGIYLIRRTLNLRRSRHYGAGFVILALYLVVLRVVMLYFGVPFLFFETHLFNPRYFGSSVVAPSLGDQLLNCIVVVILALYLASTFYRTRSYYWLLRQSDGLKAAVSVATVVISYSVFYGCFHELNTVYEKSGFTLDITLSLSFSSMKLACLLVFIGISTVFFLLQHVFSSLFIRLNLTLWRGIVWFTIGSALAVLIFWQSSTPMPWILGIQAVYFMVLYISRFPRALYSFRYKTTLYLFFTAFICASVATYVVYNQGLKKDLINKREFGKQLQVKNDAFGEFLLNKSRTTIMQDPDILRALTSDTILVRERIQQRVKNILQDNYFSRYAIDVLVFNKSTQSLDSQQTEAAYQHFANRFYQDRYRTQYTGLYFINDGGNNFKKQYIQFLDINEGENVVGHIVLDLKLNQNLPSTSYPELLIDRKFIQAPETDVYNFGFFSPDKRFLYSNREYNYELGFPKEELDNAALYDEGISYNSYKHVGLRDESGQIVIVSSKNYPLRNIFSNFSFLYLVLILYILLLILAYTIRFGLSRFYINYSTKTQLYLNAAFFLPLVLVVAITFGVISSNYDAYQENTYLTNAKNISSNFLPIWTKYLQSGTSEAYIEEELEKITQDDDIDISVFDVQGNLCCSTQPLVYESGHLSKRINAEAYIHLVERKENQVLLTESLGTKTYRTAYASIKSYDGKLRGMLGISHFSSEPELEHQMIDVVSTALSVFTGLFMIFLLVSYWASNVLTKPLKIITQKIRKTNLDRFNEPLDWKSDDEIGLLIGEYNRMLIKLEEKKQALSQSEKQSAWREMAKQVAHEIKNPLTPMKLTLQHLQRTLQTDNPTARRVLQRTLETLLDQIDNLSDIATSFSDFAKMPLPKNELFEITSVINKAADLYADDGKISLVRDISPYPVMVMGDRQLIGRILTNLIINSVQSVSSDRKPVIQLRLRVTDEHINIEICDNGAGVPEAIRSKIFLPNFTTKEGGSGLGLAIAKRGIEHAGGSIWFETETGEGTTFFITLPHIPPIGTASGLKGESIGLN